MGRRGKPWFREQTGWWMAEIGGEQKKLAHGWDNRGAAEQRFHELKAAAGQGSPPPGVDRLTREVLVLFTEEVARSVGRGERATLTADDYDRFLIQADEAFGAVPVGQLKPAHVLAWLDSRPKWGSTTRNKAITCVKAAFRWAKRVGHIEANPLADMPKPPVKVRETALDSRAVVAVLNELRYERDAPFREFLVALWESGCRPGEIMALTAAGIDLEAGTWTVKNKTRHRTRQPTRTVYLTPLLVRLSRKLAQRHPEGPMFRNARGNAWTRHALACRFGELRRRGILKAGEVPYSFRHGYITDALEAGAEVATVAELVGHRDGTMIMRVYSKLGKRREHLRRAAARVRPDSDE